MCCSVENNVRLVCADNVIKSCCISYRTDKHLKVKTRVFSFKLHLNFVCIIFVNIKDNKQLGM